MTPRTGPCQEMECREVVSGNAGPVSPKTKVAQPLLMDGMVMGHWCLAHLDALPYEVFDVLSAYLESRWWLVQ